MSYSQLYVINKELKPEYIEEYQNSWLFPIPIGSYLVNKYSTNEEKEAEISKQLHYYHRAEKEINKEAPINFLNFLMFDFDGQNFRKINKRINESQELFDRIGWEIIMQQMFETKEKHLIAQAIEKLCVLCNGDSKRFYKIAEDIRNIKSNCPYFIFKNNTIDDGVEKFFSRYNEEIDEEEYISLQETTHYLHFDIVKIQKGIMSFANPYKELNIKEKERKQ